MNVLGISAFYHDSAAAIVCDGRIVAAAQEERFTRIKHDASYPAKAVEYCLREAAITPESLDYVVFYEKPLLKFDRLLETYLAFAPRGLSSFSKAIPAWLKDKLFLRNKIRRQLGEKFRGKQVFVSHHESHCASAFFPSPFDESAVLTVDGVGEWATATVAHGRGSTLKILKEMHFPHSLGLLYSAFTYYTGFKVNSGEYKLMGLAPYGRPVYADTIKKHLVKIFDDGSIHLDMSYFNYCHGLTMTNGRFAGLFGVPPRKPETEITQFQMDIAASIQAVTEEVMLKMVRYAKQITGSRNLCLAGGCALNCVANGKILASGEFDHIWIQPASGDAGGSLGAALFVHYQLLESERNVIGKADLQQGSLLGPRYSREEIKAFLDATGAVYRQTGEAQLVDQVAEAIQEGGVIGWFSGRGEFGPRALGARSIIGDPRDARMQSVMNLKIKYRESFRPFAPCVLEEDVSQYFDLDRPSPYMLLVAPVLESQRLDLTEEQKRVMREDTNLCKRVNIPRSKLPAVTHIDNSARVQTVDPVRHGRFYSVMKRFKDKTGCGVVINTSFNIRGEPIVGSPADAFRCFMNTEMDLLVLENFLIFKKDQPVRLQQDIEQYKKTFKLD